MLIRQATSGDFPAILAILGEAAVIHAEGQPNVFRVPEEPLSDTFLADIVADPGRELFVAIKGEVVVGLVSIRLGSPPPIPVFRPRSLAHIEDLGVRSGYRRQGIGTALVAEAEKWADAHGAADVQLSVYEFNDGARRLYESLGYSTVIRRMEKRLGT